MKLIRSLQNKRSSYLHLMLQTRHTIGCSSHYATPPTYLELQSLSSTWSRSCPNLIVHHHNSTVISCIRTMPINLAVQAVSPSLKKQRYNVLQRFDIARELFASIPRCDHRRQENSNLPRQEANPRWCGLGHHPFGGYLGLALFASTQRSHPNSALRLSSGACPTQNARRIWLYTPSLPPSH
jgi:hypothetical protein